MRISIILPLNLAVIIFLFLIFPSSTNSMNIMPEFLKLFVNQMLFNYDPSKERTNKILNIYYRRYLFSKDFQENEKLKISFLSNIFLFREIANKIIGPESDIYQSYNTDYELGLCKMLNYRQKLDALVKGEKRRKMDCSAGESVKKELEEFEDLIRETDFVMFFVYFIPNSEFDKMMENFMDQAKDKEIEELRKRFVELFGLARMLQLAVIYPTTFGEIMNPNGDEQKEFEEKMVVKLIQEYLEIKRPKNMIKKWTIRYTLNYFIYNNWWQKYNEETFKDKKPNPAKLWEKALNRYWSGENVLRWEMNMKGKEGEIKKYIELFQDITDNFLDMESFAEDQLLDKGSYLEGAKKMTEHFWQFISTGKRKGRCSNIKLKLEMNEKEMEKFWVKCVEENLNLKYVAENLKEQKEMYTDGMMNLMMKMGGKGDFILELTESYEKVPVYKDENFKDLFNYERSEFSKKYFMKINNMEEKNVRITNKGKEISSSISHPIYPKEQEKKKEIENEGKDEIIEENEEAKTIEMEDRKGKKILILEGENEKMGKSAKKNEILKGKSTVVREIIKDKKKPPISNMAKKIEQQLKVNDGIAKPEEKPKIEKKKKKMEAKTKKEEEKSTKKEEDEKKRRN